ncbi:MAG: hypothetical protein TU35_003280 [Thermoproteus sp. AZ2]|jgi:hypothetical protein|uniref:Uncharacterized protein n=1 Tax=Thermoproteus sp. AZ2 TaxID=1609232 RepID=A0ACC6V0L8_9CREN|nr:MAG: hypothetical protein TU35_01950 [Thermoproteus sp. AZ2]
MDKLDINALVDRLRAGENLEVKGYEGDLILVDKVKGIVKGEVAREELSELKKRRPRGGPTKKQLETVAEAARVLAENKLLFKVVFGPKEATIRLEKGFIRLTEEDVRVAGFSSLEETPLPLIMPALRKYGEVKLLRPLR